MPARCAGLGAQGQDGGCDHVSGRGNDVHMVRLGHVGGLGGNFQRLVPAPRVDESPSEHGQASAAGASHAGSLEPVDGVLQQADRQVGFVQQERGGTCSPQRRLVEGRAGDSAQVWDELASAADRVGGGAYPKFERVDVNARALAGGRRTSACQQIEGAAYRLAAGGSAGLVGDGGRAPECVPGEGQLVRRCLFGNGDERGQCGGALARPGQRPPGGVAGGQPQFRICRDGQGAGGEILDPVRLASRNGGSCGGDQPPCLVCAVGAELGRAFHRQRRSGRAAAMLRLASCGIEQRSHVFVRMQRRGGQVPGSPVRLLVQGPGELPVRHGTLGKGRGVIDSGADQGMGELQAGPVHLDQAQLLGRRQGPRIWPATAAGCRAQVRAVGHRSQQQRGLRLLGQGGEPGGDDGAQPVT